MQALIATSRSVSQDVFLQKQNEKKYKIHKQNVSNIKSVKQFPVLEQARQVQKMSKTIYKYKQSAKTFKQQQEMSQRKRQNRILLQKIWKMGSNIKTDNNVMHLQHLSGSNWITKKRQSQNIKQENKKLGIYLLTHRTDVKDYKKKLNQQIKEYLELRKNIRKCTYEQDKKKELKRAKSQRKGIVLKLKDDQQGNENKDQKGNSQIENVQNKEYATQKLKNVRNKSVKKLLNKQTSQKHNQI